MTEKRTTRSLHPATKAFATAAIRLLRGNIHTLERKVEQRMCRCTPLREQLAAVDKQLNDELRAFDEKHYREREAAEKAARMERANIHARYSPQRKQLSDKIGKIDEEDHPVADKVAEAGRAYYEVWAWEAVLSGRTLPGTVDGLLDAYVEDLARGWTPTLPAETA